MSLANTDPWRRLPRPKARRPRAGGSTARRVREARDRLTSSSGTKPAFDYELLRQYAQNRLSGALGVILLATAIGLISTYWASADLGRPVDGDGAHDPAREHGQVPRVPRRSRRATRAIKRARLTFIVLDLLFGLAWTINLVRP